MDGLQQQKARPGSTPLSQGQESEAIVSTVSPGLNCPENIGFFLVFFFFFYRKLSHNHLQIEMIKWLLFPVPVAMFPHSYDRISLTHTLALLNSSLRLVVVNVQPHGCCCYHVAPFNLLYVVALRAVLRYLFQESD